jgi:hypothetical protein
MIKLNLVGKQKSTGKQMEHKDLKINYCVKALLLEYYIINGYLHCNNSLNNSLKFKSMNKYQEWL